VTAEALEQSVLESKDKDQLLAIAKALGLKASARTKKADIITLILDTTNSGSSPGGTMHSISEHRNGDSMTTTLVAPLPAVPGTAEMGTVIADQPNVVAGAPSLLDDDAVVDEPASDWELELAASDVDESAGDTPVTEASGDVVTEGAPSSASGATPEEDATADADDAGAAGDASTATQDEPPTQQGGDQRTQRNDGQQGGQQQAAAQGEGENRNRRRRRRRKGKGARGDEGPQGEDQDLVVEGEAPPANEPVPAAGYLDMRDEGYGFLRIAGYLPNRDDSYVPVRLARQHGLRKGDHISGVSRPAQRNEKNPALLEVHTVNGMSPEAAKKRPRFEDLTALFPDEKLRLEDSSDPANMTARIIDLISPIGKGQRGIIVSPPKAGKTFVVKTIAHSIERNNPEVKLIVLLIDERPEEVTDMRRNVQGEVISSTFDRPSDEHTHVAELAIEKAKRMVEQGDDVVVILDGITRLSRAYNLAAPASGRILSGGIDAGALYPPKKFFGAARNVEEGGSLTILATALVDTNSRMDEAIFEEFKGTGNMELRLDRKLAERRIYPAIDVDASSTRHEELLFDRKQLQQVWKLRRVLSGLAADGNAAPGLELLIDRLKTFRNNDDFLAEIGKQATM
jgi:transcription termination factor Rho